MKIALYTSSNNSTLTQITTLIKSAGLEYQHNPETTQGFDIAISFGGDGTFLSSVRMMGRNQIPIIGINSGRLGFLSTVNMADIAKAIEQIVAHEYSIEKRTLIKITTEQLPADIPNRALNEFTIQKRGTSMISLELTIDNQEVGKYWADGIIVSTPTGSTAYSMSVGGAILAPSCSNFIISPIAPHNLNIRPLVVSDKSVVKLRVKTRTGQNAIATVDNLEYEIQDGMSFELHRSKYELEVIKLHGSTFFKTIREKLLWGVDPRN